jgi:hypothetical protein
LHYLQKAIQSAIILDVLNEPSILSLNSRS